MRAVLLLLLLATAPCLGCGGGGASTSPLEQDTLLPIPALTGYGTFPLEVASNTSLCVGDTDDDLQSRGYCAIDLTGLPPGVHVESALLQFHYGSTVGFAWDELGNLAVDHVDLGTLLDPDDFNAPALSRGFAVLPHVPVAQEGPLDVTAQVRRDLAAGRRTSGFRFRFLLATNDDGSRDLVYFAGADSRLGPYPYLIVTFRR